MWRLLTIISCHSSGSMTGSTCTKCTSSHIARDQPFELTPEMRKDLSWILELLLDKRDLVQTDRHRVLAILAVRSFAMHTTDAAHLDLRGFFAQHCLKSLHSSIRELRIAASKSLVAFIRPELPEELLSRNRRLAFDLLIDLSGRNLMGQHESLIIAWGQIVITGDDQERNLALLHLVGYLGHTNALVCSLAFCEVSHTCGRHHKLTVVSSSSRRPSPCPCHHKPSFDHTIEASPSQSSKTSTPSHKKHNSLPNFSA